MSKWLLASLVLSLAIGLCTLNAQGAHACTMGPSVMSVAEVPAADLARMALKGNDLVAEVTVVSRVAPSERGKMCQQLINLDCTGANADPRCDGAVDHYFESCYFDAAIRVRYGQAWKDTTHGAADVIYVKKGGYPNQFPDPSGSCDFTPVVKPGDSFVFCGSIDSDGALTGDACNYDALFDQVKRQRDALTATVRASPRDTEALGKLAQFLEDWGEVEAALKAYAQLRELSPGEPVGYAGTGRILYAKRKYADAVPYLEQALNRAPGDAAIASMLAAAQREVRYCAAMKGNPLLACREPL